MDERRFDQLTETFARGSSRRSMLRGLFAGAAATALMVTGRSGASAAPGSGNGNGNGGPNKPDCCPAATPTLCGTQCVDLQSDPNHCGTCNTVCASGVCNAGSCAPVSTTCEDANPCTIDYYDAGTNQCVHVTVCDGTACGVGMTCQGGVCKPAPVCTPNCAGKTCGDDGCGGSCGTCVDEGAASCGTNGVCNSNGTCAKYPAGTTCGAAVCSGSTFTPAAACDGSGSCVPPTSVSCSPYNCNGAGTGCLTSCASDSDCTAGNFCNGGQCVANCPAGQTHCGNACVSTATDVNNCGGCGNVCPAVANGTATCSNGVCGGNCNAGFANCDGSLADGCEVNLLTDVNNCGACGHACSLPNAVAGCIGGSCVVVACVPGFANCDLNPGNGCEVNLLNDVNNCGACGVRCPFGTVCANGTCL